MPDPAPIEVALLAAGRSARMRGTNKLAIPVRGEPLLRRSARLWTEAGHAVTVITGPDDALQRTLLAGLPVRFVANPDAAEGQHTSVMAALAAAPLAARALAIALADQPLLEPADIAALLATFDADPDRIALPRHAGQRGNPVILPAAIARRLREEPALGPPRRFIDAHPQAVQWHEAAHARFTTDLDTPEDVARILGENA